MINSLNIRSETLKQYHIKKLDVTTHKQKFLYKVILEFVSTLFTSLTLQRTVKNTVISPNLLVWKFCAKAVSAYFRASRPKLFGFRLSHPKFSTPEN